MVAQFENYVDDSSAVHKALDSFISELPTTMAGKDMPLEQLRVFDSQLLSIIADGMESQPQIGGGEMPVATQDSTVMVQNVSAVLQDTTATSELNVQTQQGNVPSEMTTQLDGGAQASQVVSPDGTIVDVTSQVSQVVATEDGAQPAIENQANMQETVQKDVENAQQTTTK